MKATQSVGLKEGHEGWLPSFSYGLAYASVCSRCSHNNMDPGSVSLALQGLTQVEEMLISPVMPIIQFI